VTEQNNPFRIYGFEIYCRMMKVADVCVNLYPKKERETKKNKKKAREARILLRALNTSRNEETEEKCG
jgi:cytochrome c biogenesis protein ResB